MTEVFSETEHTASRLNAWLLDMGFTRTPSREHLLTLCRGNYRTVWESLMKQVHPQSEVRNQRLQVFAADIKHCWSFEDDVHERIRLSNICEELEVWRETEVMRKRVAQAEVRVAGAKRDLRALNCTVTDKLSQREDFSNVIKETWRLAYALKVATDQYRIRGERLTEMVTITDQLSSLPITSLNDISKLVVKCMHLLVDISHKRIGDVNGQEVVSRLASQFNSTAISNNSITNEIEPSDQDSSVDMQDRLFSLLDGVSTVNIWGVLHNKQDQLIASLMNSLEPQGHSPVKDLICQSAMAESSSLHCKLVLRALDMRQRASALEKKLITIMKGAVVEDDQAARELLVLRCEEAGLRGRVTVLHTELTAVRLRSGTYQLQCTETEEGCVDSVLAAIVAIDRDVVARKSEIETLLVFTEHTRAKIASVVTHLETLLPFKEADFSGNKGDALSMQGNYDEFVRHFKPSGLDVSVALRLAQLKEFYSSPQTERRDLSLDLDCSTDQDSTANDLPKLIDELRFFLEKFHLHHNRKLVLPNGESIWISETLENNRMSRHYSVIYEFDLVILSYRTIKGLVQQCESGKRMREALGWTHSTDIDTAAIVRSGSDKRERIMKMGRDSIAILQQTCLQLNTGLENLKWWDTVRGHSYISEHRAVFGKGYRYYQTLYSNFINNIF